MTIEAHGMMTVAGTGTAYQKDSIRFYHGNKMAKGSIKITNVGTGEVSNHSCAALADGAIVYAGDTGDLEGQDNILEVEVAGSFSGAYFESRTTLGQGLADRFLAVDGNGSARITNAGTGGGGGGAGGPGGGGGRPTRPPSE